MQWLPSVERSPARAKKRIREAEEADDRTDIGGLQANRLVAEEQRNQLAADPVQAPQVGPPTGSQANPPGAGPMDGPTDGFTRRV